MAAPVARDFRNAKIPMIQYPRIITFPHPARSVDANPKIAVRFHAKAIIKKPISISGIPSSISLIIIIRIKATKKAMIVLVSMPHRNIEAQGLTRPA